MSARSMPSAVMELNKAGSNRVSDPIMILGASWFVSCIM